MAEQEIARRSHTTRRHDRGGGPMTGKANSSARRLADLLGFLSENRDITHPDGCQAVTGYYDDPQRLAWSSNNRCPYSHPRTVRGLRVQYARRGWTDLSLPLAEETDRG